MSRRSTHAGPAAGGSPRPPPDHILLDQSGGRLRIIASPACLRLLDITGLRERLPLIDGEPPG